MSLNKVLVLSGALLLGNTNANANINQESNTFNPSFSTKTNYQIINVKVGIESIFSELQKIKKICSINGKNEFINGGNRQYIENFDCLNGNIRNIREGEIKTILHRNGKVNGYKCYDLEASLKLISNGQTVTIINGKGAILEDKNGSLLMSEECSEITSSNK